MGARPGDLGTDGDVLAGVLLAALDPFFHIQLFFRKRGEQGRGNHRGEAAIGAGAIEEVETAMRQAGALD